MEQLSLRTVHASVRPARVALLIDRADPEWPQACLRVIEFYSRIWGGAHNIIVPTDGTSIDERFWALLESFDPDYILRYMRTLEDVAIAEPLRYEAMLERKVDEWLHKSGSSDRATSRRLIDEQLRRAPTSKFDISVELEDQLKVRLSPFWFQRWVVRAGPVTARSAPPFELTDITSIIGGTEHPDRIAAIEAGGDALSKLWYAAETGLLDPETEEAFEKNGITVERTAASAEIVYRLVEFVVSRNTRGFTPSRATGTAAYDLELTPYRISMLQLGLYLSTRYEHWKERGLAIAGNTVDDFCLYYCLSRLRQRVAWVLPSLTERAIRGDKESPMSSTETSFLVELRSLAMHSDQHERGLQCATYSLSPKQLDKVVEDLGAFGGHVDPSPQKVEAIENLVRFPLRAVERDNFLRDVPVQLSDGRSVSPFPTPKPKHFAPIDPYNHRYITQLSVADEAPPKHPSLGELTIPDPRLGTFGARVGSEGPAYFCPNIAYFGGDIDSVLVRPHLHLPDLSRIIAMLTAKQGYECRPSDKGIYADESIAKWTGLENIVKFLRDPERRAILDQFRDCSESSTEMGVYLSGEKRRYLGFDAIKRIVGESTPSVIDELIARQILYRGFIFGCSFCRHVGWFSVAEITHEFKCPRCGRTQTYVKRNWRTPEEPAWAYKLDELVYQGYRHGMAVSLLALGYLKNQSRENFAFATDREFWKPGADKPQAEADFFCVADGVLMVGEAKRENSLGSSVTEENAKINKYKQIVTRLSARQLVLATLSPAWRTETVAAVSTAFSELPSVRLIYLDSSQLL